MSCQFFDHSVLGVAGANFTSTRRNSRSTFTVINLRVCALSNLSKVSLVFRCQSPITFCVPIDFIKITYSSSKMFYFVHKIYGIHSGCIGD